MMEFVGEFKGSLTAAILTWMTDHASWLPLFLGFLYVVAVFGGRNWMRNRKPYMLRRELAIWNTLLALFSIVGLIRTTPLMLRKWSEEGLRGSACSDLCNEQTSFWIAVFTLSKVVEFGDTFFVVARKTPLMFLHWYHHVTVSIYSWYNTDRYCDPMAHLFTWMNLLVHSVMYTYYMFKATGFWVPKSVSKLVTILQLCQFVAGLVSIVTVGWHHVNGYECHTSSQFVNSGLLLYGSYLALFAVFFYKRYVQ